MKHKRRDGEKPGAPASTFAEIRLSDRPKIIARLAPAPPRRETRRENARQKGQTPHEAGKEDDDENLFSLAADHVVLCDSYDLLHPRPRRGHEEERCVRLFFPSSRDSR